MKQKLIKSAYILLLALLTAQAGLRGSSGRTLNIKSLQLSPNPFTPHSIYQAGDGATVRQGLRVRFEVETLSRFFWLTVRIHNIEGNVVRTITELEPKYTDYDKLEPAEIIIWWDGKNDFGQYANNGRYIVHIKVSDTEAQTFSAEKIRSVVLIK